MTYKVPLAMMKQLKRLLRKWPVLSFFGEEVWGNLEKAWDIT